MGRKDHWESIYRVKRAEDVSWFQPHARLSLSLIQGALGERHSTILDVGGGASTLAGDLLSDGYKSVVVLDLALASLFQARQRLGQSASRVSWTVGDVLAAPIASNSVALWHDRAVFHFLTAPADRAKYIAEVRRIVRPGGLVLVATFAADGPERCSGLPVARYDPDALHAVFDGGFELLTSRRDVHYTPRGVPQPFTYCLCRYAPQGRARAAA
jgi:ubiquinone/menaquinone biosynthesis C-methylase UbiE